MPVRKISYTGNDEPVKIVLNPGKYFFDCFGASGGNYSSFPGGAGAHVSAFIGLKKKQEIYVFVGGQGKVGSNNGEKANGGFNGGGSGGIGALHSGSYCSSGSGGGGSTDIRLKGGKWDAFDSLSSRIIVAAGGGGSTWKIRCGHGGALEGFDSQSITVSDCTITAMRGATQSTGFDFGIGQDGGDANEYYEYGAEGRGGSGGGWFGGISGNKVGYCSNAAGSGGSSYVSGYFGCEANPSFKFLYTAMKGGNETLHYGNGYALITQVTSKICTHITNKAPQTSCFVMILVSTK